MALAAIKNMSVWDIAVMCSRVSYQHKGCLTTARIGWSLSLYRSWSSDETIGTMGSGFHS